MAVKDRLGNDLKINDLVQVQIGPHLLLGRIHDIKTGGLVKIGGSSKGMQEQVTAGEVYILMDYGATFDPRVPACGEVTKVHDPGTLKGVCAPPNTMKSN